MRKKSVLKIIIAVVVAVVILAGGFLLGFNFISLKAGIFQSGLNKSAETNASETSACLRRYFKYKINRRHY